MLQERTCSRSRGTTLNHLGSRSRQLVVEFLLIVVGILAALAVNAWWQNHMDRVREQEYLQHLLSDVVDNQRRLEEALALEQDQLQRVTAALTALRGPDPIPLEAATSWMSREPPFPWFSDPRLLDGTMIALIETGDINVIRNNRTRTATIGYLGQLRADMQEFSRGIQPFNDLAAQLYRLMELARRAEARPDLDEAAQALVSLRGNPEAAVTVRLFRANIENRMWYLTQMLGATKAFREILQAEGASTP